MLLGQCDPSQLLVMNPNLMHFIMLSQSRWLRVGAAFQVLIWQGMWGTPTQRMTLSDQSLSCVQYLHQSTACTYCTVEAKSLRRHIMDSSLSGLQERVAHVDAAAASSVSVNVNYIIYIYMFLSYCCGCTCFYPVLPTIVLPLICVGSMMQPCHVGRVSEHIS